MLRFREQDWPPVAGETFESCRCAYCAGRLGDGHDQAQDALGTYAAVWRLDDAFTRFRQARMAFLGESHPDSKHIWLQLAREQHSRRRIAFERIETNPEGRHNHD